MRKGILCLIAAVAAVPSFVGCSQHPNIVRGQSPMEGPAMPMGMYDPSCPPGYGPTTCPPNQCDNYHFKYREPANMTYPPPQAQPSVVQYPYYTCKGPDCFFQQ